MSMELKEKVSGDSGTNEIVLRLTLDSIPLRSEYHIVGAAAGRYLAQSQFLDPGRVESGERRRWGDCGHGFLFNGTPESE